MSDIHERFPNADILEKLLAVHAEAKAGRGNLGDVEALSYEAAQEVKKLRMQLMTLEGLVESAILYLSNPVWRG